MSTKFWLENVKETESLKDLGVDGRIILKWILKTFNGRICDIYPSGLRKRLVAGVVST